MTHLHAVPDAGGEVVQIRTPEPAALTAEQVRELRAIQERFGFPLLGPIDARQVTLNAAHAGCCEEAAAELEKAGFRLLPEMLRRIAEAYNRAPDLTVPGCTCGGMDACTVCVLASFDAERPAP